MVTDTIIILLLTGVAIVIALMLWRAAEPKTYDPDEVDLSSNYDPQHDHFSADHAKKVRALKKMRPKAAPHRPVQRAAAAASAETVSATSDADWDAHLIRPVEEEEKAESAAVMESAAAAEATQQERRSSSDRRSKSDRRDGERRSYNRREASASS